MSGLWVGGLVNFEGHTWLRGMYIYVHTAESGSGKLWREERGTLRGDRCDLERQVEGVKRQLKFMYMSCLAGTRGEGTEAPGRQLRAAGWYAALTT